MDWTPYGVRPTGDRKSRRFTVTDRGGVTISGRHYAHGTEISQRQALNLKYQETGWESRSEYERTARTKAFRDWASQVAKDRGVPTGRVRASGSDFSRAYVDWMRVGFSRRGSKRSGPFARYLVGIGRRDPNAKYPVGETPSPK